MKTKRLSARELRRRHRLSALIALMLSTTSLLVGRLVDLNNTAYAFTVSLGDGYGKVFYCDSYYDLPQILQDSVDVHENQHLIDGTFCNHVESEIRAYEVQLADLRLKIGGNRARYRMTGNEELTAEYHLLELFEKETKALLKEYQNKRSNGR